MQPDRGPLPPWRPGTLDLHHISTGRGDAAFYVLPDGTTMLLDAGELDPFQNPPYTGHTAPPVPDATRPPHEWIVRYIRQMWPHPGEEPSLDHALVTHFHDDHFGGVHAASDLSATGAYRLTGITGVGDAIPIRQFLDRGYPSYDYPISLEDGRIRAWAQQNPGHVGAFERLLGTMRNYWAFQEWHQTHHGMELAQLAPGRTDQIALTRDRALYPQFEVRNVACNGAVWTGAGTETSTRFPSREEVSPGNMPGENQCSAAIRIRYGRFSYFTGGDISGLLELDRPAWYDVETPVASAVGPTDVITLNHHAHHDTHNEFFVRTLRPRVMVQQSWSADQPGQDVLVRLRSRYLYPGARDMFATCILPANQLYNGRAIEANYSSTQGHIVVRVEPGGETYSVYILDDQTEERHVLATFGPYRSGENAAGGAPDQAASPLEDLT